MYNCEVCGSCSAPRESRLIHPQYRAGPGPQQLEREVAVCKRCFGLLREGLPFNQLAAFHGCGLRVAEPYDEKDHEKAKKMGRKPLDLGKPLTPRGVGPPGLAQRVTVS